MDNPLAFMTPRHHAVRNFVVLELPRNHGRPLRPVQIAAGLGMELALVIQLLDDLEKHLFFLVRDQGGNVSWAFPLRATAPPTGCDSAPESASMPLAARIPSPRLSSRHASETCSHSRLRSKRPARTAAAPCTSWWTMSCGCGCVRGRRARACSCRKSTGQLFEGRTSSTIIERTRYSSGQKNTSCR